MRAGRFPEQRRLPDSDDFSEPARRHAAGRAGALGVDLGKVAPRPVSRYLMLAYDDLYSIEYFQRRERAWWRRNGAGISRPAARRRATITIRCAARSKAFDDELMADLRKAGGEKYARLAALAYRQTLAAHKLVADADGTAMYFPKENFSNGCIATVDVIYPSSPFTLLFNPDAAQGAAAAGAGVRPHGPLALAVRAARPGHLSAGQRAGLRRRRAHRREPDAGGRERQHADHAGALAQVEGNAAFAEKYWPQLTKWAEYLKEKGLDPENQLSTDDFAGHLAHNANLSIKAILALGAYGMLAEMTGHASRKPRDYRKTAQEFASKWIELADDGDHYRLAFDKPGTWSQKYNLVWDKLLGLNLFPPEVARKEIAFYQTKQNKYGLPLDNRKDYTKLDWMMWTATLADNQADFEKLVAPAYQFANESPSRVPLTDWYDTVTGKQQGFQARSVVGGLFIKMLADPAMWRKYAAKRAGKSEFCLICSNN